MCPNGRCEVSHAAARAADLHRVRMSRSSPHRRGIERVSKPESYSSIAGACGRIGVELAHPSGGPTERLLDAPRDHQVGRHAVGIQASEDHEALAEPAREHKKLVSSFRRSGVRRAKSVPGTDLETRHDAADARRDHEKPGAQGEKQHHLPNAHLLAYQSLCPKNDP